MAFPSSPVNGEQYTQNGFIYQYDAALNLWRKIGTAAAANVESQSIASLTSNSATINTATVNNAIINSLASLEASFENGISIGNTTVNTSIRSTFMFSGNTSSNSFITPLSISVSNTLSNSTISSQIIFVGNTTANASFNLIGGSIDYNITSYSIDNTGKVTLKLSSNHNLTDVSGVYGTISGLDRGYLNSRFLLSNTTVANVIVFTPINLLTIPAITAVKRTNGVFTYVTRTPHGIANGSALNITGLSTTLASGSFNQTNVIVTGITNTSSFTTYNAIYANPTKTLSKNTAGGFTFTAVAGYNRGTLKVNDSVDTSLVNKYITISGVNGGTNGTGVYLVRWPKTTSTVDLNKSYKVVSVDTSTTPNTIVIDLFWHSSTGVPAGTLNYSLGNGNPTFVLTSVDIPNTVITSKTTISVPTQTLKDVSGASISAEAPIYISVGNTYSSTKVTPTSIFVGGPTQNSVIIDADGTRFIKRGSVLQTSVDGEGFSVLSYKEVGGTLDPAADQYFANSSVISLGNNDIQTTITKEVISTPTIQLGDSYSNVSINGSSIVLSDLTLGTNTIITSTGSYFNGTVTVTDVLVANGILANNSTGSAGQVLTSNGNSVYWSTPSGGGGGGGTSVTMSSSAPVSPSNGDLWWNTEIGSLYIYYNDGDTSQWVEASPNFASGGGSGGATTGRSFTHAWFFGG